jgi:RHS repeat-associated protein
MQISERSATFSINSYKYGFNGKEHDDEVNENSGDYVLYTYRIQDTRLGRFLSVDPLSDKFPNLSSYQFASNSPIENIDIDGLEAGSKSFAATMGITISLQKKPTLTVMGGASIAAKVNSATAEMGGKFNLALKSGSTPKYHFMAYASAGFGNTLGMKTYATSPTLNSQETTPSVDFVPNAGTLDNSGGHPIKDGFVGYGIKFDQGNMNNSTTGLSSNLTLAKGPLSKTKFDNRITPNSPRLNFNRNTASLSAGFAQRLDDGDKSATYNFSSGTTRFESSGFSLTPQWSANTLSTTSLTYTKFTLGKSSFKAVSLYTNQNESGLSTGASVIKEKGGKATATVGVGTGPTSKK